MLTTTICHYRYFFVYILSIVLTLATAYYLYVFFINYERTGNIFCPALKLYDIIHPNFQATLYPGIPRSKTYALIDCVRDKKETGCITKQKFFKVKKLIASLKRAYEKLLITNLLLVKATIANLKKFFKPFQVFEEKYI